MSESKSETNLDVKKQDIWFSKMTRIVANLSNWEIDNCGAHTFSNAFNEILNWMLKLNKSKGYKSGRLGQDKHKLAPLQNKQIPYYSKVSSKPLIPESQRQSPDKSKDWLPLSHKKKIMKAKQLKYDTREAEGIYVD